MWEQRLREVTQLAEQGFQPGLFWFLPTHFSEAPIGCADVTLSFKVMEVVWHEEKSTLELGPPGFKSYVVMVLF